MAESPDRTAAIRERDPATIEPVVRECLPGLLRTAMAAGLPGHRAEDLTAPRVRRCRTELPR